MCEIMSEQDFPAEIGKCYTIFEGDLRRALKNKKTKVYGKLGFIGFALFWRSFSVLEKIKTRLKCEKCSFYEDWLE